MGSWSDLVWIIHGQELESAVHLGIPDEGSLGKGRVQLKFLFNYFSVIFDLRITRVYLPTQSHKSKCQSYMYICVIETHRHINRMKVYYLNASFLWSALPTPMYGLLCLIYCCAIIFNSATLLWPCLVSQSFILFVTLLCLIRLIS